MNEETVEYDDLYAYYEEIQRREVEERYARGYLEETKRSPIREDARRKAAVNDLNAFLDAEEDDARGRGYAEGQSDSEIELAEETDTLQKTVDRLEDIVARSDPERLARVEAENEEFKKLRDEAVDEKKRIFAEISYFLGTLVDTDKTPTDDVEAWAYQDGNNQAIMKVQEWVSKMSEAKKSLEGDNDGSYKDYYSNGDPDQDEDDEDYFYPPF